jgi:hypothetical protein
MLSSAEALGYDTPSLRDWQQGFAQSVGHPIVEKSCQALKELQ